MHNIKQSDSRQFLRNLLNRLPLPAAIGFAGLLLTSQSSIAKTVAAGPFVDLEEALPGGQDGGTVYSSYTGYILYYGLGPVLPIKFYDPNYQLQTGQVWVYYGHGDRVVWHPEFLFDGSYRVIGVAFPTFDDIDTKADIHIRTIYGPDLNPDGSTVRMGGFTAAQPEISFSEETFVAPDGTDYPASPARVVAIQDVAKSLPAGADLSFLQGNPTDVVYIFDTTLHTLDFENLTVVDAALALGGASSVEGGFGVNLPLTNTPATAVEPRNILKSFFYSIEFSFNNNLSSVANATASCGTVVGKAISATDPHLFTVNLRAPACNAQNVTVTLTEIVDDQGNALDSASATVGLLIGDVDADRTVTRTDFRLVNAVLGQTADTANFRADINANGKIDTKDGALVRQHVGDTLPLQ